MKNCQIIFFGKKESMYQQPSRKIQTAKYNGYPGMLRPANSQSRRKAVFLEKYDDQTKSLGLGAKKNGQTKRKSGEGKEKGQATVDTYSRSST